MPGRVPKCCLTITSQSSKQAEMLPVKGDGSSQLQA